MKQLLLLVMAVVLVGCESVDYSAQDMSKLEVGMTKQQVIAAKGEPFERSVNGDTEYLIYAILSQGGAIWADSRLFLPPAPTAVHSFYPDGVPLVVPSGEKSDRYYVRLVGGKVNSFGKVGDFNSTQDPTPKLLK